LPAAPGPHGQAWAVNRLATLDKVEARVDKSGRKKDGGQRTLDSKRPLIGERHSNAEQ
jgi:hypothetical protein